MNMVTEIGTIPMVEKEDVGKSIDAFSDNSFLLTCETESFGKGKKDIWLLKIDSNGKIIWENTLGGKKNDIFTSGLVYSNSSIYISGQRAVKNKFSLRSILIFNSKKNSPESANYSSFIARLNGKGEIVWENDDFEDQKCITPYMTTLGKNILIAGQKSTPFNGSGDAWFLMNKKGRTFGMLILVVEALMVGIMPLLQRMVDTYQWAIQILMVLVKTIYG